MKDPKDQKDKNRPDRKQVTDSPKDKQFRPGKDPGGYKTK